MGWNGGRKADMHSACGCGIMMAILYKFLSRVAFALDLANRGHHNSIK
jgi:hypothetical protein